jgi:hypothetical protein
MKALAVSLSALARSRRSGPGPSRCGRSSGQAEVLDAAPRPFPY